VNTINQKYEDGMIEENDDDEENHN